MVQISWRNSADVDDADGGGDADGEIIERDGRRLRMPRYDNGRHDESDCVEGEVTTPAMMIEHAAEVAEPVVVEPEPEPAVVDARPVWPGPYPPPPLVAHLYAPYAPPPRVAPARPRR